MKVIKWLDKHLEETVLLVLLVMIFLVMTLQIFSRSVLNTSLSWPEEFSRYCFVYSVFFSISYTIRNNIMMRVDIVTHFLPKKIQQVLLMLVGAFMIAFFAYLFYHSWPAMLKVKATGQLSPALRLPIYVLYVCFPIGFFLSLVRSLQSLYFTAKDFFQGSDFEEGNQ